MRGTSWRRTCFVLFSRILERGVVSGWLALFLTASMPIHVLSCYSNDVCCARLSTHNLQRLAHKLPLAKTQPPLTRPLALTLPLIQPLPQPPRNLLPHLPQIPPQNLGLLPTLRRLKRPLPAQRKPRLPRQRKINVERDIVENLLRLPARRGGAEEGEE